MRRQTSVPVIQYLFVTVYTFLLARMCLVFAALGILKSAQAVGGCYFIAQRPSSVGIL